MAQSSYNPTDQDPYTAPPPVVVTPTPPPIEPQTPPPQQRPPLQAPNVTPGRPGAKAAGISYLIASALKGIGQGHAAAQQIKFARTKRTMDGLKYAYDTAAQSLAGLTRAGADPKEIEQAKAARDAAWAAYMKFYGQTVFGEDQGGKPKGKAQKKSSQTGGQAGAMSEAITGGPAPQESQAQLMAELASPDPKVKAQAYYKMALKLGPPDEWQIKQWNSPDVVRQRELAKRDMAKGDKKISSYTGQDGKQHLIWQKPDGDTYETTGESDVRKPVSETKPVRAWALRNGKTVSVEVDPKTNQVIPRTENDQIAPPAGMLAHIRTGEFSWTDVDGKLHRTETTTTTTPVIPSSGGTKGVTHQTKAPAAPTSPAAQPTAPAKDRVIGQVHQSPEEKLQTAIKLKDASLAGKVIADAKKDYADAIKRKATMDQNIIAARNGDQQAMLSLVANHIGMTLGAQKGARITRAIWDEAIASAPWTQTVYAKWFHDDPATGDKVFDGYKTGVTLTDQQMQQMVDLASQKVKILGDSIPQMEKLYKDELGGKGINAAPAEKSAPHPVDQVLDQIFGASPAPASNNGPK
jgi:hypothetical protein